MTIFISSQGKSKSELSSQQHLVDLKPLLAMNDIKDSYLFVESTVWAAISGNNNVPSLRQAVVSQTSSFFVPTDPPVTHKHVKKITTCGEDVT